MIAVGWWIGGAAQTINGGERSWGRGRVLGDLVGFSGRVVSWWFGAAADDASR